MLVKLLFDFIFVIILNNIFVMVRKEKKKIIIKLNLEN